MGTSSGNSIQKMVLPIADTYNPKAQVRSTTNRGKPMYSILIGWRIDDQQVVVCRRDKDAALNLAKMAIEAAEAAQRGDNDAVATATASHEFHAARNKLKAYGVSVLDAVNFFCKWHKGVKQVVTVQEAYELWLEWKHPKTGKEPVSETYWRSMRNNYLKPFVKEFGEQRLIDLVEKDFEHFLYEVKSGLKNSQKREFKTKLNNWLNWCVERGYYSELTKPLENIKFGKDIGESADIDPTVIDPKVIKSMIMYAVSTKKRRDLGIAFVIVLRVMVGVRAREARTLRFSCLKDLKEGIFRIGTGDQPKTFHRTIEMYDGAIEWLTFLMDQFDKKPKPADWIMPSSKSRGGGSASKPVVEKVDQSKCQTDNAWRLMWGRWIKEWKTWAAKAKQPVAEIKTNALRDTFASSSVQLKGIDYTLLCMGDVKIATLKNNYLNFITKKDAQALFEIKTPAQQDRDADAYDREMGHILGHEVAMNAIKDKFGYNPIDKPANQKLKDMSFEELYFEQFIVGDDYHEVSSFYPDGYAPYDPYLEHGITPASEWSDSAEDIGAFHDAVEKKLNDVEKRILRKRDAWASRLRDQED